MSRKPTEERIQNVENKNAIQILGNTYITLTDNNSTKYTSFIEKTKVGEELKLEDGEIKIRKRNKKNKSKWVMQYKQS